MSVVLVDYGSGNLQSVARALERAAQDEGLQRRIVVSSDVDQIRRADRLVLPGVGAFAQCRKGLDAIPGLVPALIETAFEKGRPFLGICVGMQLMASFGDEYGMHPGLDWIPGNVRRLAPSDPALKIPHMGWNDLAFVENAHPLLQGVPRGATVYFVHSYAFWAENPAHVLAAAEYGGPIAAMIGAGPVAGVQFHPEKSQAAGLRVMANFLRWSPS